MSSLYEDLNKSRPSERRDITTRLISSMRGLDNTANLAFWRVCQRIITDLGAQETAADESLPRWEFPADNSALLVRSGPRVRGFLNAIARAPQAETIIDAGCGSSAILSVGAAVTHPRAEVFAYEINEPSARCAEAVIKLLGLCNRVNVRVGNVITDDLPAADLAVTETFSSGLLTEMGHTITEALARTAQEVLPASVLLHACDENVSPDTNWQQAAAVDLTAHNTHVTGRLISTGKGDRPVRVYASYFDARREAVIAKLGANNLTNPVFLGAVSVPRAGVEIGFNYELGAELHENPALLWAET